MEIFEYKKISSVNCVENVEPDVLFSTGIHIFLLFNADCMIEVFSDSCRNREISREGKIGDGPNGGVQCLEKSGKRVEPLLNGLKE